MRLRHLSLIPLLLVMACQPAADKYPYPPQYVSSLEVPPTSIAEPPRQGSAEYDREVEQVVAMQATLTQDDIAAIRHQIEIRPEKIVYPTLGQAYTEDRYPALYALLKRAASDSWRIGDDAREYWKSPRPWYTEPRVKRYVEEIRTYGYPSGHTTTFGTWAYVLSDLLPAKREAFFEAAWNAGGNRIKGGAHYPHDIVGGKQLAAAVYNAMRQDKKYQEDRALARFELRHGGAIPKSMPASGAHPARPSLH